MHLPPQPDARELLPPLLACLPTAFLSPRPPPAVLPILAPVLRQRLNFLSTSGPTGNDGWLSLLSWDQQRASKLPAAVERMELEPHPVSGEIELDDVPSAAYRRLDGETLHARLEVEQFDLLPIFLWCESDEHGGTGPGWKLAELRTMEDVDDGTKWSDNISAANDAFSHGATQDDGQANGGSHPNTAADDADDDDYWASYDRSSNPTPAPNRSPAPRTAASLQPRNPQHTQDEHDYYARYGTEVQPAMDSHDPDEEHSDLGTASTLTGDALVRAQAHQHLSGEANTHPAPPLYPKDPHDSAMSQSHADLSMPRPLSPSSSSSSSSIDKLEARAATSAAADRAQWGIKQHISTDIKSLFRLARSAGMERKEFERVVKTELEVLGMFELDD